MGTIGALAIEGLLIGGLIGRFSGRFQNKTSLDGEDKTAACCDKAELVARLRKLADEVEACEC